MKLYWCEIYDTSTGWEVLGRGRTPENILHVPGDSP